LIFAASKDKDLGGMLALLAPHFDQAWFTRYTTSPRGAATEELACLWQSAGGGQCQAGLSPAECWQAACQRAAPTDLICITGSVFLAGELHDIILQS
jgi:dihydrofolate synthase/folylpolyglutamate synthase